MHKHQTYIFRELVLSALPSLNEIKSDEARTMVAVLKPGGRRGWGGGGSGRGLGYLTLHGQSAAIVLSHLGET